GVPANLEKEFKALTFWPPGTIVDPYRFKDDEAAKETVDVGSRSQEKHENGRVAIFVRHELNFRIKPLTFLSDSVSQDQVYEVCGMDLILPDDSKISRITVYRAPKPENLQRFFYELNNILNKTCSKNLQVILCGDLNIDHMIIPQT
ncbi:hypothetical protein HHI36_018569, partial [Cryptolaemus montrouzieri]